jgi:outer membrane protein TolC
MIANTEINGISYTALGTSHTNSFSYGITAKQLIFDGFSTLHMMLSASESSKAAEENYKASSASIRQALVQAFAGLLAAQDLVKIDTDIADLRKSQLNDITLLYQSGREDKGNYMHTEATYEQAVYSKNQAARGLELSKAQLCFVMGRDEKQDITVTGDFAISSDLNSEPDYDALTKDNPTMQSLTAQKNSADYAAKAALGSFLPSVYITGSAGREDDVWVPQAERVWSVGVNASMPLFEGGALVAKAIQAHAAYDQAAANEKAGRDQVIQSLIQAWKSLIDAKQNVAVQKAMFDSEAERAKIADVEYQEGIMTFDDWTLIQDSFTASKTSYLNAETNLLTAEAAWIQAKGGTLEDEKK